jgi:hypothetical protein
MSNRLPCRREDAPRVRLVASTNRVAGATHLLNGADDRFYVL